MSEYQYYEFQAVDRPLGEADREKLREISTRAEITATSFINHYEWGDFGGSPKKLMRRWFDLHIYLANWGERRLMIKLPKKLIDRKRLDSFLPDKDMVRIIKSGENVILDIHDSGEEGESEWVEGSGWLAALAPLRDDMLSGDWRLLYLIWLVSVERKTLGDDEREPLPGIAPLSGALETFADFFRIDLDLVRAAAEAPFRAEDSELSSEASYAVVEVIPEAEKTALLHRLAQGDPQVAAELRGRIRDALLRETSGLRTELRTVSDLRARAAEIRRMRADAEAKRRKAERRRKKRIENKLRCERVNVLRKRNKDEVWKEVESEIERRTAPGYQNAVLMISDLRTLAEEDGGMEIFLNRIKSLRLRHETKKRFIERLAELYKTW